MFGSMYYIMSSIVVVYYVLLVRPWRGRISILIDVYWPASFSPSQTQTHEDYRGIERAKEAMVDVAQYINEVKRDTEHVDIIQKVRVS